MRAATGGLAASDRTIPPSMMAPRATRLNRSIVHHHAANGVRSTRESMGLVQRFHGPNHIGSSTSLALRSALLLASRRTSTREFAPAAILRDGRAKSAASSG